MCHISRWLDAHEALYGPVTAPPGSLQGVQPWQRSDGAQSTTYHVLIPASVRRVSDLSGCLAKTPCGLSFYVNFALLASGCSMLQLLQDGQQAAAAAAVPPRPLALVIEGDCNLGKSFAMCEVMLRPLLSANPTMPMLFVSVRITHAYDLYATLVAAFMQGERRIPGVDIVCYKTGAGSAMERVRTASQLVISYETMEYAIKAGHLSPDTFRNGVVIFDEVISGAQSLASERGTIKDGLAVAAFLAGVTAEAAGVIALDRDVTLTQLGSRFLALAAGDRDVMHLQLTACGQPGSCLVYTSNVKRHNGPDSGLTLAMNRLRLHVGAARQTHEQVPDDDSESGPVSWQRVFIAVASKRYGERLVEQLREWGVPLRRILFYHAGINDKCPDGADGDPADPAACPRPAAKEDLANLTCAWRNVWVILATPTITVAVNPTQSFHSRWLFTLNASEGWVPASANQLMQLMGRLPRGSAEQQRLQLADPSIYVVFDGEFPSPAPEGRGGGRRREVRGRGEAQLHEAAVQQKRRSIEGHQAAARAEAARAALVHAGTTGAAPPAPLLAVHPAGAGPQPARLHRLFHTLCAEHALYRATHVGAQHVLRILEIGVRSSFERARPMPSLSDGEEVQLRLQRHPEMSEASARLLVSVEALPAEAAAHPHQQAPSSRRSLVV